MTLASGVRLGPYEVVSALGAGGMGRVYRARDVRLERDVALKVMAESFVLDKPSLARFEQEARLAGSLNHPNIISLFDVGEYEGVPYLVTELLQGETLQQRLAEGPVPVETALDWAAQMANGLAAAHAQGIVHRDVKPGNVFICQSGQLKLLDFGIAKLAPTARGPSSHPPLESTANPSGGVTGTGQVLGTPRYMSPEQVRGEPVDARADVFSLGAVLYEMLSGHVAFPGDTAVESEYGILHAEPEALPPAVPRTVAHLVRHCLEKDPEKRLQSARDLAFDLEIVRTPTGSLPRVRAASAVRRRWRVRLAIAATGLILATGAAYLVGRHGKGPDRASAPPPVSGPAAGPQAPSIAVLPFVNLSSDKEQEYFSDGLAEEVLNRLAKVPGLRVTGRTSSFSFKGKSEDLRGIGLKLNVATVLEGSVRRAGDRIRITTQLINAADGYNLWSESYDRKLTDVFAVQDEIARAVVGALKLKLVQAPDSSDRRTVVPAAYDEYLLARQLSHLGGPDDLRRAVEAYEKALQLDPGYALAWAGLAEARYWVADWAASAAAMAEGQGKAMEAAEKAIALGGNLAEGYLTRGLLRTVVAFDWEGAREDFERGRRLKPEDADALFNSSTLLLALGRLPDAIALLREATGLDPLNANVWWVLGRCLSLAGDHGAAREAFQRSLEISPDNVYASMWLQVDFLLAGEPGQALEASRRSPLGDVHYFIAALAEQALGHSAEAEQALAEVINRLGGAQPTTVSPIYASRGENDRAFEWLERARAQRESGLIFLKTDPLLRNLRRDPRYTALLKAMKLPLD